MSGDTIDDSIKISRREVSVGEGPVLLFVHGAPDFWYLWHEQMNTFSRTNLG